MEAERRVVDIDAAIDNKPLGAYQFAIICLCAATVVLDGFDNQTIGILAPSIAKDLHVNVAHLGVVFSAGLFGWMIGALSMGQIADRFGRRWAVIISAIFFSLFTLLTTTATTPGNFMVLWFMTGLGLGGAVPNALALAIEFAPRRLEAKVACWVMTGMPTGAILGGILSTFMLPVAGWRPVLYFGGALPLLLSLCLIVWLPESPRFLIAVRADAERVKRIMQRVLGGLDIDGISHFASARAAARGVPVRELFTEGRAIGTVLFWVAFFGNLLILYFVLNWFPAMLHESGMTVSTAVIATTLFSVGGAVGVASEGYLMDTIGRRGLPIAQLVLSALLIGMLARHHTLPWFVWIITAVLGMAVQGAQGALNALAAAYYPTSVRSTGIGWALGMGRTGAIIGPLLGALMLSRHWSLREIFMAGMIPSTMAAVALAIFALRLRRAAPTPTRASLVADIESA